MLAIGVEAFRVNILNFIIEIQDEYTSIGIKDDNGCTSGDTYIPTYIPKGFSVDETEDLDEVKMIHYINNPGEVIVFNRYDNKNADLRIDTENAITDKIILQGTEGLLVDKDGFITVVWHNNKYMFMLMGKVEKNELIKMAESVK